MFVYKVNQIDALYTSNAQLESDYKDLYDEYTRLQSQSHNPDKHSIFKAVHVTAKAPDVMTEVQAIQFAKGELESLVGRKMSLLVEYPNLLNDLLDNRTLTMDTQTYVIRVTSFMVIENIIHVHIVVLLQQPPK